MTQLSDNFMLEMLSKVQPFQVAIVKTGRSVHLDAHYHERDWDTPDHSIDIDFYVFEHNEIVKTFEFNSSETEEQLDAVLASVAAYAHSL